MSKGIGLFIILFITTGIAVPAAHAASINYGLTNYGGSWSASSQRSNYPAGNAFDGNVNTYWDAYDYTWQSLFRTLPEPVHITQIRLISFTNQTENFSWRVYYLDDAGTWVLINSGTISSSYPNKISVSIPCNVVAKSFKIEVDYSWSFTNLAECELWGEPANTIGLTASPLADGVTLTISGGIPPYSIYRDGSILASTNNTAYTDHNYPPGTTVTYRVVSSDGLSGEAVVLTCPSPPVLQTSADVDRITLSWDTIPTAIKYYIYRAGTKIGETTSTTYTDTNLAPDTQFTYTVSAANASGEGRQSDAVTVRTLPQPPPPDAPTNLRLTGRTATSISVAWDPVPGVSGYRVYVNGTLATITANTYWTFSGLTPGTQYGVQVQAYSGSYAGAISTTLSCSTVGVPGMPLNLTATAGASQVTLTWGPPAVGDPPTGYRVYRGSALVGDTKDTYFTDRGLAVATLYTYEVRAYNEAGEGPGAIVQVITQNVPVPDAPTGLTVLATQRTIQVSWNSVQWALGYRVAVAGQAYQTPVNQLKVTGLLPGTSYVVEVRAYNDAGESAPASTSVQTLPGNVTLMVSPYGTGYVARWDPPGETIDDLPDRYHVLVDGVLVAVTYDTYYGDGKLDWVPGSTHTITVEAYYGATVVPSSATVTALSAPVSVDPATTAWQIAFSVQSLWPLLAVVTAIGLGFLFWDKFRTLIPR